MSAYFPITPSARKVELTLTQLDSFQSPLLLEADSQAAVY